jgi:starch synthase
MVTISRLVDQKGFELIADALPSLLDLGFRYLLLGTGERRYQDLFREMASRYPERMAVKIAYDEALAHRIEAGADFYLMPSRFEPCGLNQIYSLRYGTIPLVRATGGLDDTIEDYNPGTGQGTGLKFEDFSADALIAKGHEAFLVYNRPEHRRRLIDNAMAANFSWETSARQYIDLYRMILGSRRE